MALSMCWAAALRMQMHTPTKIAQTRGGGENRRFRKEHKYQFLATLVLLSRRADANDGAFGAEIVRALEGERIGHPTRAVNDERVLMATRRERH